MFVARLLAVGLVLAGSAKAQQKLANIAYGPDQPAQTLDFYPSARRPSPLVIFVHGGDWSGGDKGGTDRLAGVLNQAGFNVASVNYRLIPKVRIADEAEDVARAGAFLLSNAGRLGIDKRRFALMGHSAGDHLVALVGTDMSYGRRAGLDMSRLAAVIPLDGVFDLSLPAEMAHRRRRSGSWHWDVCGVFSCLERKKALFFKKERFTSFFQK
jgi:acetyl esterase/lipase